MATPPATKSDSTSVYDRLQRFEIRDLDDLAAVLNAADFAPLADAITPRSVRGPKPYPRLPIIRAHLAAYLVKPKIDSITALHWSLANNPALAKVCGFGDKIPDRSTLSRVFSAMSKHPEMIDDVSAEVIEKLREILPDLGEEIAADSTPAPSYSSPEREPKSDRNASWGWHQRAGAKGGAEWVWGYKAHALADANYDIPLLLISSTGKDHDTRYLEPMMDKLTRRFDFDAKAVLADRGYDSKKNNELLHNRGIAPVIHIRKPPNDGLFDGIYTKDGVPTCMGGREMDYVGTHIGTGYRLYRCPAGGCDRQERVKGYTTCNSDHWEDPERNVRLFGGRIRRGSPEWKRAYRKRWSVERVFARWNAFGRMRRHYFRDRAAIHLHMQLQMLSDQAAALAKLNAAPMEAAA